MTTEQLDLDVLQRLELAGGWGSVRTLGLVPRTPAYRHLKTMHAAELIAFGLVAGPWGWEIEGVIMLPAGRRHLERLRASAPLRRTPRRQRSTVFHSVRQSELDQTN